MGGKTGTNWKIRHWPPKSEPACLESKKFRKKKSKLENKFWKNEIENKVKESKKLI